MNITEKIHSILSEKWNIHNKIEIEEEVADELLTILSKAASVTVDEEGALIIGVDDEEIERENNE